MYSYKLMQLIKINVYPPQASVHVCNLSQY